MILKRVTLRFQVARYMELFVLMGNLAARKFSMFFISFRFLSK